jgi:hypothetical protein
VLGFQFVLPKDIPSSIFYKSGRNKSKVKYCIAAKLKGSHDKIKSKQILMIRAPPVKFIEDSKQSSNTELNCCCCFGKGAASAKVEFEKNIYCPNEVAKAIVHVDNTKGEVDCTAVSLNIVQTIHMNISGRQVHQNHTLAQSSKVGPPAG